MYKYEMNAASIVDDTERSRLHPPTYRRKYRGTRWKQYTSLLILLKPWYDYLLQYISYGCLVVIVKDICPLEH